MCGAIGLIFERCRGDLGLIAADLLKMLEYRGYDSTGAAIQGAGESVWLAKGVGAPSRMVHKLGIVDRGGQIFCGQVRWATFGAVDEANSQPHEVACKCHLYGAHNGNVTNCDALKAWLLEEGHEVRSDNDGEMVVHTIEHYFALGLDALAPSQWSDGDARRAAMRAAIGQAIRKIEGSFAAVIADPQSRTLFAMKLGSSLYFGFGQDDVGGTFGIASSDLSSVLKLTRLLVPLSEGELIEFTAGERRLFRLREGIRPLAEPEPITRDPIRSRLQTDETALLPPFKTFMAQEISAQEATVRSVVERFLGGSENARRLKLFLDGCDGDIGAVWPRLENLRDQFSDEEIEASFCALVEQPEFRKIFEAIPHQLRSQVLETQAEKLVGQLVSSEAGFLADLVPFARTPEARAAICLIDFLFDRAETARFAEVTDRFVELCEKCLSGHGRIFVICCGSSFHAAKAAAFFFNELAHAELIPLLPGDFRGQYSQSLRDGDVFVAVSQSGETKDLIDVMNGVIATKKAIERVGIVNNVSSTLGQEKCPLVIPLQCGPEIAVPATKSFINQVALFYCLALKLARRRAADPGSGIDARALAIRYEKLPALPELIRASIDATAMEVEQAAQQLYLAPSLHLLATRITAVAREGALKIREVVLNHAEGFEGSEFKHGPNTILGVNTIFGAREVNALLRALGHQIDALLAAASAEAQADGHRPRLDALAARRLVQAATDTAFASARPFALTPEEEALFAKSFDRDQLFAALYVDYPLIFITGPDDRDVALTVSQINTHKIRGASPFVIAEDNPALRAAAEKPPTDNPAYRWGYLALPRTGDALMAVFSASVVLQRLALRMSVLKAQYLDRIGFKNHGVHPDVPKNVSKSITVD